MTTICKCGKEATHKARLPIRLHNRTVISSTYWWCQDCLAVEKQRTPGVIAVAIKDKG